MKLKPLLLIIPFVVVFSALLVLDAPDKASASGGPAASAVVEPGEASGSDSSAEGGGVDTKDIPDASGSSAEDAENTGSPQTPETADNGKDESQDGSQESSPSGTEMPDAGDGDKNKGPAPGEPGSLIYIDAKTGEITFDLLIGQLGSTEDDPGIPVYEKADTNSDKLGTLQFNCCVLMDPGVKAPDGWAAVELASGRTGFVETKETMSKTISISDNDKIRMDIVTDALRYLGLKFSRYGKSLTKGIDCSNFISAIYAKHELDIPDTCNEQIALGKKISRKDARPGDIVYYDVNSGYGHVGIYLGSGFLINSTGHAGKKYPDGGVRICDVVYRDREEPEFYDIIDYR